MLLMYCVSQFRIQYSFYRLPELVADVCACSLRVVAGKFDGIAYAPIDKI
jgi:hypothetical protein